MKKVYNKRLKVDSVMLWISSLRSVWMILAAVLVLYISLQQLNFFTVFIVFTSIVLASNIVSHM